MSADNKIYSGRVGMSYKLSHILKREKKIRKIKLTIMISDYTLEDLPTSYSLVRYNSANRFSTLGTMHFSYPFCISEKTLS